MNYYYGFIWFPNNLKEVLVLADATFIVWIQQFSTPLLDSFFKAITFLGDEEYYILSIPLLFWLYNKKFALRFGAFFLLNAYINSFIKHIFATPRPAMELRKITQEGYSFPSGHAQGNTSFWGYLAVQVKKRWAYITAVLLFCLVAFSRVYLGVHFPIDIIVGILIGIAWILAYEIISRKVKLELSRIQWFLGSLVFCSIMLIIHPTGDGPLTMGFLLGALWGYRLEADFVDFDVKGNWWQNIAKAAVGLAILFALRVGLKIILMKLLGDPGEGMPLYHAATFIRYFGMGIWVALAAPWLFRIIGLERKDTVHKIAA